MKIIDEPWLIKIKNNFDAKEVHTYQCPVDKYLFASPEMNITWIIRFARNNQMLDKTTHWSKTIYARMEAGEVTRDEVVMLMKETLDFPLWTNSDIFFPPEKYRTQHRIDFYMPAALLMKNTNLTLVEIRNITGLDQPPRCSYLKKHCHIVRPMSFDFRFKILALRKLCYSFPNHGYVKYVERNCPWFNFREVEPYNYKERDKLNI